MPIDSSPFPFMLSTSILFFVVLFISYFFKGLSSKLELFITFSSIIGTLLLWWKDMVRESLMGYHTHKLELSMRFGMMLFILSECFFFLSFFWCFFDSAIAPTVEYGMMWPPKGINSINPYSVPLLNTIILLSSGITITWSHHAIINNDFNNSVISLLFTVLLGIYFLITQVNEYQMTTFSMSDGVYGSIFFLLTGFHGFHVFVGTTFLSYVLYLMLMGKLLSTHHFSFEAAAWYWHFVDVVWIFLFIVVYVIFF